jgi:hypothetical protein
MAVKVPTIGKHYDTVTVPALNELRHATLHGPEPLPAIKAAVDAAAAAGATPTEIADAVGGRTAWNELVRALKGAGLV